MAKKKNYKLDLWKLFTNINLKNIGYYDSLPDDQIKEFQPLVIMRWLTGSNDSRSNPARQLYFLNEFVNPYVFNLSKHKKLLYNLMTISTVRFDCRYKFIKAQPERNKQFPNTTAVIKKIFKYNTKDAHNAIKTLKTTDIIKLAIDLGCQDNEIKEIKLELKNKPA